MSKSTLDYDISVGDSYAAGYHPAAAAMAHRDTHGFAYQVVTLARARGYHFILRNFACDDATSTGLVHQVGCPLPAPGPDAVSYPDTDPGCGGGSVHRPAPRQVGLITVSIGGNDILGCTTAASFIPCVTQALPGIEANLHTLLAGLRQAAGPTVPIVGLTYPDAPPGPTHRMTPRRPAWPSSRSRGSKSSSTRPSKPNTAPRCRLRRRDGGDQCIRAAH